MLNATWSALLLPKNFYTGCYQDNFIVSQVPVCPYKNNNNVKTLQICKNEQ